MSYSRVDANINRPQSVMMAQYASVDEGLQQNCLQRQGSLRHSARDFIHVWLLLTTN
jgi:hypothetical protein